MNCNNARARPGAALAEPRGSWRNAHHILVVDDDAKIRLLLRRCFEGEGYRVTEAASGAEALERVAAPPCSTW